MTITVTPAWQDVAIRGGRAELQFIIRETDRSQTLDAADAFDELLEEAPETYGNLPRSNSPDLTRVSDLMFLGRVEYAVPPAGEIPTGGFEMSFDIGGQNQRVYQSLNTVNTYAAPGETAPDFKGAINVTRDGVQGADIIHPTFQFARTYYVSAGTVTTSWIQARSSLVGTVSSSAVLGFPAGEMLLTGFSGTARPSEDDWSVTFRWARRPNIVNESVFDISGINQDGWDYRWAHFIEEADDDAKMRVRRVLAIYVERVYRRLDHAALLPT